MAPSEILQGLRNDGWSLHHRAEGHRILDALERRLQEIKEMIGISDAADTAATTPLGGS